MHLPNFLVIGTPKAGTSSLYEYLKPHPEVFLPAKKELHYFSRKQILANVAGPGDENTANRICKNFEEYQEYYKTVSSEKAIGDISPSYFFFSDCYSEIKEILGTDVKLILMLREPTSRAFSNYLHLRRSGRETLTFEEALEKESERKLNGWGDFWQYSEHGFYAKKLEILFNTFKSENILIVKTEEFTKNKLNELNKIYSFIGINKDFIPENINVNFNQGGIYKNPKLVTFTRKLIRALLPLKKAIPKSLQHKIKAKQANVIENNIVKDIKPATETIAKLKLKFAEDQIDILNKFNIKL